MDLEMTRLWKYYIKSEENICCIYIYIHNSYLTYYTHWEAVYNEHIQSEMQVNSTQYEKQLAEKRPKNSQRNVTKKCIVLSQFNSFLDKVARDESTKNKVRHYKK